MLDQPAQRTEQSALLNTERQLHHARKLLQNPRPATEAEMTAACDVVLKHSRDMPLRRIAEAICEAQKRAA